MVKNECCSNGKHNVATRRPPESRLATPVRIATRQSKQVAKRDHGRFQIRPHYHRRRPQRPGVCFRDGSCGPKGARTGTAKSRRRLCCDRRTLAGLSSLDSFLRSQSAAARDRRTNGAEAPRLQSSASHTVVVHSTGGWPGICCSVRTKK